MDDGEIELQSGAWRWRISQPESASNPYNAGERPAGDADPDPRPDAGPVLLLEDPADPDHWMAKELERALQSDTAADRTVASLAERPDRRQVVDEEGVVWRIDRIDDPDSVRQGADADHTPRKVSVSSGGGPRSTVSLPEGRYLGQLTRDEVLRLVGG